MIASDSYNVQPRRFDTIILNAGERFDLIVKTNHTSGDFWIRVRGLGICFPYKIESFALLRYVVEKGVDKDGHDIKNMREENSLESNDIEELENDNSEELDEFDYPLVPEFEKEFPRNAVKQ